VFHFNKAHLADQSIPMWVLKFKGQTIYVDHVDMDPGVGFHTKETPDNPHTKGSIRFRAKLSTEEVEGKTHARIFK
jgi:hypothetical protein